MIEDNSVHQLYAASALQPLLQKLSLDLLAKPGVMDRVCAASHAIAHVMVELEQSKAYKTEKTCNESITQENKR
jgi:hypothetical protein